jgi:hypothetical protein
MCKRCGAPANCYGMFCGDCMERVRNAAGAAQTEFKEAMDAAPHDAAEEECLLDDLIVKIVKTATKPSERRK